MKQLKLRISGMHNFSYLNGRVGAHFIQLIIVTVMALLIIGQPVLGGYQFLGAPKPAKASTQFSPVSPQPNIEIYLSLAQDGTSPFYDTLTGYGQHTPGNDYSGTNGIVRTNDTVQYRFDWNVNEQSSTNVVISATLPLTMTWTNYTDYQVLPTGCLTSGVTPPSRISADRRTFVCNLGNLNEGTTGAVFMRALLPFNVLNLDNQTRSLSAVISSDRTAPVNSNVVSFTISATPMWDWVKAAPDTYDVISGTVAGTLYIWPISVAPVGLGGRGAEPMNESVPLQFYDWAWNLTPNAVAVVPGTESNYAGWPTGRKACGGYDTSGPLPYGDKSISGANSTNTTSGAWASSESITCVVNPKNTNDFRLVKMTITGYKSLTTAKYTSSGGLNYGAAIAAQIAFFVPNTELQAKQSAAVNQVAILTNTIAANLPVTSVVYGVQPTIVPITVSGTSGSVNEPNTANNSATAYYIYTTPSSSGVSGAAPRTKIDIAWMGAPVQEYFYYDPETGHRWIGADDRSTDYGGNGSVKFNNENYVVSRGESKVIVERVATDSCYLNPDQSNDCYILGMYGPAGFNYYRQVHACQWIDTEHFNITNMGQVKLQAVNADPNFQRPASIYPYKLNDSASAPAEWIAPSDGIVHVRYGDITSRDSYFDPARSVPPPNYIVEVAHLNLAIVPKSVLTDTVTCNDANADARGWVASNGSLSSFDTLNSGDGIYEDINAIRLRGLEPVPYSGPNRERYAASYTMYVQGVVKDSITADPAGSTIYLHGAFASGPWTNGAPETAWHTKEYSATREIPGQYDDLDFNAWSAVSVGSYGNGNGSYRTYHDKMVITEPSLTVVKSNIQGANSVVDVGDLVTYTIRAGAIGSPVDDWFTNHQVNDYPDSSRYTIISATTSANGVVPTITANSISWQITTAAITRTFGGWSDVMTVTLQVKDGRANEYLSNRARNQGYLYGSSSELRIVDGLAGAYMVPRRQMLQTSKTVQQPLGPCISEVAQSDTLDVIPWSQRCAQMRLNGEVTYTLQLTNNGNDYLNDIQLIDVNPFNGDNVEPQSNFSGTATIGGYPTANTLGDGRDPASDYNGTLNLKRVTIRSLNAAIHGVSWSTATIYVTTDPIASINRNPLRNTNTWTQECNSYNGPGPYTCTITTTNVTAFKVVINRQDPLLVETYPNKIEAVYGTSGNKADDLYTNNFGTATSDIFLSARSNDVSAMPDAVNLVISKQISGSTSTGSFTMSVSGPNNFVQSVTLTPGTPVTLSNLLAGVYTVTESALPTAPISLTWGTVSYAPTGGVITLNGGITGFVTVTNQLQPIPSGTIIIRKNNVPIITCTGTPATCSESSSITGSSSQRFDFTHNISLTYGTLAPTFTMGIGDIITFSNVLSGVYAITETLPIGWAQGAASCSDGATPSAFSVAVGITTTCLITNVQQFAGLNIIKQVTGGPDAPGPYSVTVEGPEGFQNNYSVTTSAATVITQLLHGAYTATEQLTALPAPPFGYTWTTTSYTPANGQLMLVPNETTYLTITNALTPTVQRFGNRLWLESDTDGDATTNVIGPLANHLITATAQNGVVYTTMTDANGLYTFTVPAGVYTVTYGTAPAGYQASTSLGGSVITSSSTGDNQSHANNSVITLNPSEVIMTVDFGFNLIPQPHISINKVADPYTVRSGDYVTYTIALINDGTAPGSNIVVHDLLPTSVTYISSTATIGTYTASTGDWIIQSLPVSTQTLTITVRVK